MGPPAPVTLEPAALTGFTLRMERLGVIMRPEVGRADEAGGVCNPACARGRDGTLYLFPRLVAAGNYSRVGIARVLFDAMGTPNGVERLGIALQPEEPYEKNGLSGGGIEDPRITHLPGIDRYLLAYAAYGQMGPRVALAVSDTLFHWTRLGVVDFAQEGGVDFNAYPNKDAFVFPEPVRAPDGQMSLCLMHRPLYERWGVGKGALPDVALPVGVSERRPSIWLSYSPLTTRRADLPREGAVRFGQHRLLAIPQEPWEHSHIGGGTPPIATDQGWLTLYHGVERTTERSRVRYCAGALVLDRHDPTRVLYRTRQPLLEPLAADEITGVVSDVVFPTAIDPHDGKIDVYYGMADASIGAARLIIETSPPPS